MCISSWVDNKPGRMNLKWFCKLLLLVLGGALGVGCVGRPAEQAAPQAAPARQAAIPESAVKMSPETDPHPPVLHLEGWQEPVAVPGSLNTAGAEDSPFILPDGKTMYFTFTPDASLPAEQQLFDGVTGTYVSRLGADGWGQVERVVLQTPGKLSLDGCPFTDGKILWFCSTREGYTGMQWFTAQFQGGTWRKWQYAGDQFKPGYEVGELHITADGQELYFHSSRPGGQGQLDIWVTRKVAGVWQEPENVVAVNSPDSEGWPFVSQDGNELWFTRFYLGAPAIFRSLKSGGVWSAPELVVSQFAGEPTLDEQGDLYFVHHFVREEIIEADIYVAYRR
jgi:ribosomal protein L24E